MKIPKHLTNKTSRFPEYSQGANQVTLRLKNGVEIKKVFLAWGEEIVKIGEKSILNASELSFLPDDIEDVISEI